MRERSQDLRIVSDTNQSTFIGELNFYTKNELYLESKQNKQFSFFFLHVFVDFKGHQYVQGCASCEL